MLLLWCCCAFLLLHILFCSVRPQSTRVWWVLLEDTTWTIHHESRPRVADRVFSPLPSGFRLHDNERDLSRRSAGCFVVLFDDDYYDALYMYILIHIICLSSSCVVPWIVVSMSCDCSSIPWKQEHLFHGSMLLITSSRTVCRTSSEWSALSPRWPSTSWRIIIPETALNW